MSQLDSPGLQLDVHEIFLSWDRSEENSKPRAGFLARTSRSPQSAQQISCQSPRRKFIEIFVDGRYAASKPTSMKTELLPADQQDTEEYPCLKRVKPGRCAGCDYVVLFTGPITGTIVCVLDKGCDDNNSPGFRVEVGHYYDAFASDAFQLYHGKIILSQ